MLREESESAIPMEQNVPDEILMNNYAQGDVLSFEVLVKRHEKSMYNYILRILKDYSLAEDVLQETFIRVVRHAARYRPDAKFTTWLYRIARNLCIDKIRRKKIRNYISLSVPVRSYEGSETTLEDCLSSDDPPPEEIAQVHELEEAIEEALAQLPTPQREVFLFRHQVGLSFKEISDVMECPEATAKSRMRYALMRIREHLERGQFLEGTISERTGEGVA